MIHSKAKTKAAIPKGDGCFLIRYIGSSFIWVYTSLPSEYKLLTQYCHASPNIDRMFETGGRVEKRREGIIQKNLGRVFVIWTQKVEYGKLNNKYY